MERALTLKRKGEREASRKWGRRQRKGRGCQQVGQGAHCGSQQAADNSLEPYHLHGQLKQLKPGCFPVSLAAWAHLLLGGSFSSPLFVAHDMLSCTVTQ